MVNFIDRFLKKGFSVTVFITSSSHKSLISINIHNAPLLSSSEYFDVHCPQADWLSKYYGPSSVDYPRPYFVEDFQVGVSRAKVDYFLTSLDGKLL